MEGIKGVKYALMPPRMYKNGEKKGKFHALFGFLDVRE
jgi:hypothetical protein